MYSIVKTQDAHSEPVNTDTVGMEIEGGGRTQREREIEIERESWHFDNPGTSKDPELKVLPFIRVKIMFVSQRP